MLHPSQSSWSKGSSIETMLYFLQKSAYTSSNYSFVINFFSPFVFLKSKSYRFFSATKNSELAQSNPISILPFKNLYTFMTGSVDSFFQQFERVQFSGGRGESSFISHIGGVNSVFLLYNFLQSVINFSSSLQRLSESSEASGQNHELLHR
jgi:hypothetical protein